jgi:hypothetical protein
MVNYEALGSFMPEPQASAAAASREATRQPSSLDKHL